jgi:hypothetical protein
MVAPSELPRNASEARAQSEGPRQRGGPKSAAEDSIKPEPRRTPARSVAKTLLRERLPWVTILLYPTASERGECILAMLFWVLAALAVVGALAIDWGLYLLVRRWL